MSLRPYQAALEAGIYQRWQHCRNVLAVLPTGGGKTVVFAKILADTRGPCIAVAHRAELVSQMSLALARNGVRHRVVAPDNVRAGIEAIHMAELGRRWVDQNARCAVAGVDTLVRRPPAWLPQVELWVQDEAHHVLRGNKWGKAVDLMPNARGLGVTATPMRADGKGLGRHADGVFDELVEGPSMRELIDAQYLSPYRIFAPPSTLHREEIHVTAGGDFAPGELREATRRSTVLGDVVEHYCKITPGKLGVTFADSVENATDIMTRFRARGVPAEILTGETPDVLRAAVLRRFRAREVLQIVNVALLDEGFDCPAIEVVSDASATESYGRYAQRFGRMLRILDGKTHGIYLDHVGNVKRHGLPDAAREWSLDRRERGAAGKSTGMPLTICVGCTQPYERFHPACPYCGWHPEPVGRSSPQQVDGDLLELDPEALAALRGEIARVDGAPRIPQHLDGVAARGVYNRHIERQQAQARLRATVALWAGYQRHLGRTDAEGYRLFYLTWGTDVATAQTLGAREADELAGRVQERLTIDGVVNKMADTSTF